MTGLHRLCDEQGQSPWLDNITRPMIRAGRLHALVDQGVRGVTSNPTIFQKAMASGDDYDEQFVSLLEVHPVADAYWQLVIDDVVAALDVLRPVHDASRGSDGFVSLEVAPAVAADTGATIAAARGLHARIDQPNLLVKIPATPEGVPAIRQMIAEGRNINVTLIFGLDRYAEVIEAYLAGLELVEGDLSSIHSVASFFVSRVDTEVDRRLAALVAEAGEDSATGREALALRGQAALAQAKLAYQLFLDRFSGPRWQALRERGARPQRPLWASTSTKNPEYPDLLYVDGLIGPATVDTMPDQTLEAFLDHGTLARTVDADVDGARLTLERVTGLGIDLHDVAWVLEHQGVASFAKSFDEAVQALAGKADRLLPSGAGGPAHAGDRGAHPAGTAGQPS